MEHSQVLDFICNIPFLEEDIKNIFENLGVSGKN